MQLIEPTGADTILWIEIAGQPLTIRVDSQLAPAAGDQMSFGLDSPAHRSSTPLPAIVCDQ